MSRGQPQRDAHRFLIPKDTLEVADQFNFVASGSDYAILQSQISLAFGELCQVDECSPTAEMTWELVTPQRLIACLSGEGPVYVIRTEDVCVARRTEKVSRGFPLDRHSAPIIEIIPSRLLGDGLATIGRFYLYANGCDELQRCFQRLRRRLLAASKAARPDSRARVLPEAAKSIRFITSIPGARPQPLRFGVA